MKSKSIFIAADLIPALLDGRKKCMRRIMKPQPTGEYARTFQKLQCISLEISCMFEKHGISTSNE